MKINHKAFSLVEMAAALVILGLVSSGVLVAISRCSTLAANSTLRLHAFEVARENMETLLTGDTVKEMTEYGSSDMYPQIQWKNVVETFYEPLTMRMWIRAVCSAEYMDNDGQTQTVELTHWLTDVTKQQLIQIIEQKQKEKDFLAQQENIGQDIAEPNGQNETSRSKTEQSNTHDQNDQKQSNKPPEKKQQTGEKLICGYTMDQINQMDFQQLIELLFHCD